MHSLRKLVVPCALVGALSAQNTLFTFEGDNSQSYAGESVKPAGDIDGDGVQDLVVGAPRDSHNGPFAGAVMVYSGHDGRRLLTVRGSANSYLGTSVDGVGDVTGDGCDDLLAGAPGGAGAAYLISGMSGSVVATYTSTLGSPSTAFGYGVSGLGDVNNDGTPDLLVAGRSTTPSWPWGYVQAISGATGLTLYIVNGGAANDFFGFAIDEIGDVSGDGRNDFLVGAPLHTETTKAFQGAVHVVNGATGAKIRKILGEDAGNRLGYSVADCPDLNADGTPDFLAGVPGPATRGGLARTFSGSNGAKLTKYELRIIDDWFGTGVDAIGDLDGDGLSEVLIGSPWLGTGRVDIFSGTPTSTVPPPMLTFTGDTAGDEFGWAVCGLGDVNADNVPDFAVGAHNNGNGYTRVLSGKTLTMWSDTHEISLLDGGTQNLLIQVSPVLGAMDYAIFGSATGIGPTPVGNGINLPLTSDVFTTQVIAATNLAATNFVTLRMSLPPPL